MTHIHSLLSQKPLLIFYNITRIFLVIPHDAMENDKTGKQTSSKQVNESRKRLGSLSDIVIINLFLYSLSLMLENGSLVNALMQLTSIQMDDIDTFGGVRVRELTRTLYTFYTFTLYTCVRILNKIHPLSENVLEIKHPGIKIYLVS